MHVHQLIFYTVQYILLFTFFILLYHYRSLSFFFVAHDEEVRRNKRTRTMRKRPCRAGARHVSAEMRL